MIIKTVLVFFKAIAVESVTIPAIVFQPFTNFFQAVINGKVAGFKAGSQAHFFNRQDIQIYLRNFV